MLDATCDLEHRPKTPYTSRRFGGIVTGVRMVMFTPCRTTTEKANGEVASNAQFDFQLGGHDSLFLTRGCDFCSLKKNRNCSGNVIYGVKSAVTSGLQIRFDISHEQCHKD